MVLPPALPNCFGPRNFWPSTNACCFFPGPPVVHIDWRRARKVHARKLRRGAEWASTGQRGCCKVARSCSLVFFLLEKCWVLLFRALVHPEWHLHRVWYSFWGCRLIWHLCWLVVVSHNFTYVHCFFWRMPLAWLMPHLTRGFVGLKHVDTAHQSKPLPCRLLFTVVLLEKLKNDKSS